MPNSKRVERLAALVEESAEKRARVRRMVVRGQWKEAEPDLQRRVRYMARRRARITARGAEAAQGPSLDFQSAAFLAEGAVVRRAIAYVEVNDPSYSSLGTGFLVSPGLFLTNQHVIRDASAARAAVINFDREIDEQRLPREITTFTLDPDRFALFSAEDDLDFALIAVGARRSGAYDIADFGYCALSDGEDRHALGINVNIIQHPHGWHKMIAVRNNLLTHRTPRTLLYETDTEIGSSGSPVFNDDWDLVALHHWGSPFLEKTDENGDKIPSNVNEGVRISAIVQRLKGELPRLVNGRRDLLAQALACGEERTARLGPVLSDPPPAGKPSRESATPISGPIMSSANDAGEIRVTVPIEIVVRVGGAAAASTRAAGLAPEKALTLGAEAVKIDRDYSNREGYVADFIPGFELPLPTPDEKLAKQVAPLRAEEPDHEAGELKYQHFSLKMHRAKRLAIFTATNIDGPAYLAVSRETGEVAHGDAEGETWYKDPRISASYYIDQPFYSEWSIYFDRGHLTRRTDPTWGTKEDAERANADTFHFTNCSPQHFRFNQTTRYWQGVERYVLEQGAIATESKCRICVFQGPIFDDRIDKRARDVQIPSSFWKIVAWRAQAGLKAVGLVVDQLKLLCETRVNLGKPRPGPPADISEWRVAIAQIEKRTGLDFGDTIRNADTFSAGGTPVVGAEAARPIRGWEDLLR